MFFKVRPLYQGTVAVHMCCIQLIWTGAVRQGGGGLEQGMILVGPHRRVVAVQAAELHAHAL